jgi:hypothetical protein
MAWIAEQSLPTASSRLAAAVCDAPASESGMWVYAVGGMNPNTIAAVQGYDTVQEQWFTRSSMPTPRGALGAASSTGLLHAIGGFGVAEPLTRNTRSTSRLTTLGQQPRRSRLREPHSPSLPAPTG